MLVMKLCLFCPHNPILIATALREEANKSASNRLLSLDISKNILKIKNTYPYAEELKPN